MAFVKNIQRRGARRKSKGLYAVFDDLHQDVMNEDGEPLQPYFKAMCSKWMKEIPENFSEQWLMKVCPNGKRTIVVAAKNFTKIYNKYGITKNCFYSSLPGGNYKFNGQRYTVLDCIHNARTNVFFIIDVIAWNNCTVAKCSTEVRFFFLQSRIDDTPNLAKISQENEYIFKLLPFYLPSPETIQKLLLKSNMMIDNLNVSIDGILFFNKEARYMRQESSLVQWIKPFMIPELFNVEICEDLISEKPNWYTNLIDFVGDIEKRQINRRKLKPTKSEINRDATRINRPNNKEPNRKQGPPAYNQNEENYRNDLWSDQYCKHNKNIYLAEAQLKEAFKKETETNKLVADHNEVTSTTQGFDLHPITEENLKLDHIQGMIGNLNLDEKQYNNNINVDKNHHHPLKFFEPQESEVTEIAIPSHKDKPEEISSEPECNPTKHNISMNSVKNTSQNVDQSEEYLKYFRNPKRNFNNHEINNKIDPLEELLQNNTFYIKGKGPISFNEFIPKNCNIYQNNKMNNEQSDIIPSYDSFENEYPYQHEKDSNSLTFKGDYVKSTAFKNYWEDTTGKQSYDLFFHNKPNRSECNQNLMEFRKTDFRNTETQFRNENILYNSNRDFKYENPFFHKKETPSLQSYSVNIDTGDYNSFQPFDQIKNYIPQNNLSNYRDQSEESYLSDNVFECISKPSRYSNIMSNSAIDYYSKYDRNLNKNYRERSANLWKSSSDCEDSILGAHSKESPQKKFDVALQCYMEEQTALEYPVTPTSLKHDKKQKLFNEMYFNQYTKQHILFDESESTDSSEDSPLKINVNKAALQFYMQDQTRLEYLETPPHLKRRNDDIFNNKNPIKKYKLK